MDKKAHNKSKIKSIIMIIVFIMCFLFVKKSIYASTSTPSDLSSDLSITEVEEIEDFSGLSEMIGQIFEVSNNLGTDDLSDPIVLMYSLISRILVYFDESFAHSTFYHLLVGLALIFLVANFVIKCYEESSVGLELKVDSRIMIRKYMQFIFALIMIISLKGIVYFILGFFRFVLKLCMNVTEANFIGTPDVIDNILSKERVAYEILKQNGIVKSNTLLDEVIVRSKESAVRSQYMIPWVFSWISKLALVVVIFINSIKLFVHSTFYIVSLGDFLGDIKRSKFIEYTKIMISLVLEEAVIVVVLYLSNLLLNPYLRDLLRTGVSDGGLSFINLAMIFTGIKMSKVFVIISSNNIAKRIIGVA